jgi:hypothetical protein
MSRLPLSSAESVGQGDARRGGRSGIADFGEARGLTVSAALALIGESRPVEVYVDLGVEAVRVRLRGGSGIGQAWEVAGPLLRERVLRAVGPLLAADWRLDGSFLEAARWDVAVETGPPLYRGCWVRMDRPLDRTRPSSSTDRAPDRRRDAV